MYPIRGEKKYFRFTPVLRHNTHAVSLEQTHQQVRFISQAVCL